MFRKKQVPEALLVFAKEQTQTFSECDNTSKYSEKFMERDFLLTCEELNQEVCKQLPNALPMRTEDALKDTEKSIFALRVIQVKDGDNYVIETLCLIKTLNCVGCEKWYSYTENGLSTYKDPKKGFRRYRYRCAGREFSIPSKNLRVRDFFYKF